MMANDQSSRASSSSKGERSGASSPSTARHGPNKEHTTTAARLMELLASLIASGADMEQVIAVTGTFLKLLKQLQRLHKSSSRRRRCADLEPLRFDSSDGLITQPRNKLNEAGLTEHSDVSNYTTYPDSGSCDTFRDAPNDSDYAGLEDEDKEGAHSAWATANDNSSDYLFSDDGDARDCLTVEQFIASQPDEYYSGYCYTYKCPAPTKDDKQEPSSENSDDDHLVHLFDERDPKESKPKEEVDRSRSLDSTFPTRGAPKGEKKSPPSDRSL